MKGERAHRWRVTTALIAASFVLVATSALQDAELATTYEGTLAPGASLDLQVFATAAALQGTDNGTLEMNVTTAGSIDGGGGSGGVMAEWVDDPFEVSIPGFGFSEAPWFDECERGADCVRALRITNGSGSPVDVRVRATFRRLADGGLICASDATPYPEEARLEILEVAP